MFESVLFSTFFHDRMMQADVSRDHLVHELGYRTPIHVQSWIDGRSRPPVWQLLPLASVLPADPVDVVLGWVIDQCPELEEVLWAEVLNPRGSKFPRAGDLPVGNPKPSEAP